MTDAQAKELVKLARIDELDRIEKIVTDAKIREAIEKRKEELRTKSNTF